MIKFLSAALLIFIVLLFDLGNPDALRQGTEGFYLQVTNEMFEKSSWLTPYYLNTPHWSKPPLLFQLPQLLFMLSGESSLYLSRFSILLFSVITGSLAVHKFSKVAKVSSINFLLFCFCCLGFFKYSRIFMMEFPLLILGFLSAIYFFSYTKNSIKTDLFLSIIWGALSCMVKGPVSIVMLTGSFTAYGVYHFLVFKKLFLKEIVIWFLLSLCLSSFWFLHQYVNFGDDFIDYFFFRENFGKFASKSYPISSVFQGLLLYALPWSFLIPALFIKLKEKGIEKLSGNDSKLEVFLLACFLNFFIIWLFPQQKSHHYAVPSIPFLLSLIFLLFFTNQIVSERIRKFYVYYFCFFSIIGVILNIIGLSLIGLDDSSFWMLVSACFILAISFILVLKSHKNITFIFISHLLLLTCFWSIMIPSFALPLIPDLTKTTARDFQNIGAVHRKPYFVEQSIGREVHILGIDSVGNFLKKKSSVVVIEDTFFMLLKDNSNYRILLEWPVWKRGLKPREILEGIKNSNLKNLRTSVYLISL